MKSQKTFTKKFLHQFLKREIEWCEEDMGTSGVSSDFEEGFILALKQVKDSIRKL